ncbi:uncharacterized protein LOC113275421 [Papaver somniferum]|uniref:uncharacterized protein LOC113275421 n=1 Tax=Papaver somniferum TaxID=3469 RepID=UPI000E6F8C13|nr:uncharacterized protein LOC113275421 [Papaver somniferum]
MGNHVSCTLTVQTGGKHSIPSNEATVILPKGVIRKIEGPFLTKAAEIMFEIPNHFLVNSKSLRIGSRFSALNADEDLEMGNVYVLFPMKRVNSVVTASDMGSLLLLATTTAAAGNKGRTSASGGGNNKVRVSPESIIVPPSVADDDDDKDEEFIEDQDSWVVMIRNIKRDNSKKQSDHDQIPRLSLEDIDDIILADLQHRRSVGRSRKPSLSTITEEPVFSR